MKAIRIHTHGGPEVLKIDEIDIPKVVPGHALVRIKAAAPSLYGRSLCRNLLRIKMK